MGEVTKSFQLVTLLCLLLTSALEIEETEHEITTESFDFSSNVPTEEVTESPNDNGMAIGDIPDAIATDNDVGEVEGKEEDAVEEVEPVLITFPENHKNFTPSQYLGSDEYPPYYNDNYYKQQYKNYYDQKEFYNRKPIKFEENSTKNYFVPQSLNSYYTDPSEGGKKHEHFPFNHKPFPYAFEYERAPKNGHKYTGSGLIEVHDDRSPSHEYSAPTQHENVASYYVPPYSYPHLHEDHKNELLHHEYHDLAKHHDSKSPWKKVFHLLTALVPLGLFLATLTPNVISINSTTDAKTTRQRSVEPFRRKFKEEDVLKLLQEYGVESLSDSKCEDRIICEFATNGYASSANSLEKGFWYLANETPWDVAEKAGMNELFKAIKTGNCESYKCESKTKSDGKRGFGKKLIKKRKMSKKESHL